MKTKIVSVLLALCFLLTATPPAARAAENAPDFYHVSGRQIVDGSGNPVVLKGISFGNTNYGNPSAIEMGPVNDHDAISYFELAAMGLDHVRFEINYGLFEDDSSPYVYKDEGFDWLDQNIAWAKAAGMRLIIQMKHPQGGYQASSSNMELDPGHPNYIHSGGKALWIGDNAAGNQNRLVALWTKIAERYKDEPTVIGYGLVNEPVVPQRATKEETVAQWQQLAQRIANGIRTVDQNHILFVERIITWFNPDNYYATDWNLMTDEDTQVLISDRNTVYEFHFYEPFVFTSQGADWMPEYTNADTSYPSNTVIKAEINDWNSRGFSNPVRGQSENGWTYFESEPFQANPNGSNPYNYAQPQLAVGSLSAGDSVWFDDVVITRINPDGTRDTLYSYDFSQDLGRFQEFWGGETPSTVRTWDNAEGHNGPGSLKVSGATTSWSNASSWDNFYLEPDCTYQISGWVKGGNANCYPQVSYLYAEEIWLENKEYVKYMLDRYMAFGEKNNVPMHVGEWGFHYNCYGKGAEEYTKDLTDLFQEYGVSSNYHSYHDSTFGLYLAEEWATRPDRNETLYNLLTTYYGKAAPITENRIISAAFTGDGLSVSLQTAQGGRLIAAAYDRHERMTDYALCDVNNGVQTVTLPLQPELGNEAYVKCFLLDSAAHIPLCLNLTLP